MGVRKESADHHRYTHIDDNWTNNNAYGAATKRLNGRSDCQPETRRNEKQKLRKRRRRRKYLRVSERVHVWTIPAIFKCSSLWRYIWKIIQVEIYWIEETRANNKILHSSSVKFFLTTTTNNDERIGDRQQQRCSLFCCCSYQMHCTGHRLLKQFIDEEKNVQNYTNNKRNEQSGDEGRHTHTASNIVCNKTWCWKAFAIQKSRALNTHS